MQEVQSEDHGGTPQWMNVQQGVAGVRAYVVSKTRMEVNMRAAEAHLHG